MTHVRIEDRVHDGRAAAGQGCSNHQGRRRAGETRDPHGGETRSYASRPDPGSGERGAGRGKVASYAATRASPSRSEDTPSRSRTQPAMIATADGSLRPRGPPGGVRNGESVSTSRRSAGTRVTASADASSPRRNTSPENDTANPMATTVSA